MIEPINENFTLYKGTDFKIQFRIIIDGEYINPENYVFDFKAASKLGADENAIEKITTDDPNPFTIDATENYLVTMLVPGTETDAITETGQLYFQLKETTDGGEKNPRMVGIIELIESL